MNTRDLWKIISFYARFMPNYTKVGYYARRPFWGRPQAMDFKGQRWLVTGASAGLGKAMMHAAANAGADVVAVARNQQRLDAAVAEVGDAAKRVTTMVADMSLQSSTQALLDELIASGERFDVLMNNVGLLLSSLNITAEGREESFVTNVLSHFLLTEGLFANDGFGKDAVIVNMTSGGMYNAPLGIKGLNTTDAARYNGKASYAYAKRAQVALTDYWNRVYRDRGVRCYVTHPGWSKTPGVKTAMPTFWKIQNILLRTPMQGADTALWLAATRPPVEEDVVWFDRKKRPVHMYDYTRKAQCTDDELAAYLRSELEAQSAA
ncbi:MAG: SDR family NAD(P)-dependent oxidoreductase, partial [Rhodothermales bacterium]|nr:SDR family NAD(P)-dependent oxidoreductase [Rhodothermales bacterium]